MILDETLGIQRHKQIVNKGWRKYAHSAHHKEEAKSVPEIMYFVEISLLASLDGKHQTRTSVLLKYMLSETIPGL